MDSERYIAAIEISSSKIVGTVSRTRGDGQLDVIAVEQESGVESVRYGIIQNPEETAMRLRRIIDKLERHPGVAPRKIKGVFVGLSGRSLRGISTEVSLTLPDDTEINDEIIERLRQNAFEKAIDNSLEVVDAVPCEYHVGNITTQTPKGSLGNSIRATFELIVCRPEIRRNLVRTIPDKLGINIEGIFVTALSTGHLVLTSEEKRLGCMLADIGAETTTVSIYKGGSLRYLATLPMGGRNITRDLTSLSILEERAEEMKIASGNAMANPTAGSINIDGIKSSDVNNLIVARSEEIVANIVEQMEYAGIKDSDLPGGIICIGGGSSLNGMLELLRQQSNLSTQIGRLPAYVRVADSRGASQTAIEVVSIAYSGATLTNADCLEDQKQAELPALGEGNEDDDEEEMLQRQTSDRKKKNKLWNNIVTRFASAFAPPEDNSDILD